MSLIRVINHHLHSSSATTTSGPAQRPKPATTSGIVGLPRPTSPAPQKNHDISCACGRKGRRWYKVYGACCCCCILIKPRLAFELSSTRRAQVLTWQRKGKPTVEKLLQTSSPLLPPSSRRLSRSGRGDYSGPKDGSKQICCTVGVSAGTFVFARAQAVSHQQRNWQTQMKPCSPRSS